MSAVMEETILTADNLSFTSRNSNGSIDWFNIIQPENFGTADWAEWFEKGKAYANEYFDLRNNLDSDLDGSELTFIIVTLAQKYHMIFDGVTAGFFSVVSHQTHVKHGGEK